ncbi:UNVERIFIED_CONTAM: hypothetical protein ABIC26_004617 [Paenibacillus sp. PvR008]
MIRINVTNPNSDFINIPLGKKDWSRGNVILRNMAQDADTAYAQTIMWYITGDEVHRKNAISIIRAWSKVQSISNIYDEQIRVSLAVFKFSFAADILRHSTSNTAEYSWTPTDTTNYLHYLDVMKSKYDRWWHFMNQHGMSTMATMASAIFRDDAADYAKSVQRATVNPELGTDYDFSNPANPHQKDGSIMSQIREVTYNPVTGKTIPPNIQLVEMGRDQGHPYVDIGALSTIAMIAYTQGTKVDPSLGTISTAKNSVSIFNFLNDRILAGANYLCKYNLGFDVIYIPIPGSYSAPTTSDRGKLQTTIGIVYSYYKYIEKRSDLDTNENTKYLSQAFSKLYPEGQNADFFGDSVLLFTLGTPTIKPLKSQSIELGETVTSSVYTSDADVNAELNAQ